MSPGIGASEPSVNNTCLAYLTDALSWLSNSILGKAITLFITLFKPYSREEWDLILEASKWCRMR